MLPFAHVLPQVIATAEVTRTNQETLSWLPPLSLYLVALNLRELLLGQYSHGIGVRSFR